MPYKHNQSRRHKFTKAKYSVTNWKDYTESLRQRGDITVWFSEDAIANWHPKKIPGKAGRPKEYSDLAIECCLMLRQVYKLPLRQTEGFVRSLIKLMGLDVNAPDYTSISKRSISLKLKNLIDMMTPGSHFIIDSTGLKMFGKDEWHQVKHGVNAKRSWRKLHIAIDENHQIVACNLTDNSVADVTAATDLLNQVESFDIFMGDGAYDADGVYKQIVEINPDAKVIVPSPKNAIENSSAHKQRNAHTDIINEHGRMAWQKQSNYGLRSLVELAMLRYITIIGPKMKARKINQQKTEADISVRVLNKMTHLGMPVSVKIA